MSILSTAERFSAMDHSEVKLNEKRCLHFLDKHASCQQCVKICPVKAIEPGKPPKLNAVDCQRCLACLPGCPTGAFSAADSVRRMLECAAQIVNQKVEIICREHPEPEMGIDPETTGILIDGCLSGLGAGGYLELTALGMDLIQVRLDHCSDCPWRSLKSRIEKDINQARVLMSPWGNQYKLQSLQELDESVKRPLWDIKNPPLSRRGLFQLAARRGQEAAARAVIESELSGKRQPGRDRLRINSAIRQLPAPERPVEVSLEERGYCLLSVSEECTACQSCVRVCPTAALELKTNPEKDYFWLRIDPQLCIGCEACSRGCIPDAISFEHSPSFDEIYGNQIKQILHEGDLQRCVRCKAYFSAFEEQKFCQTCDFRKNNPFGSKMPPGISPTRTGKEIGTG